MKTECCLYTCIEIYTCITANKCLNGTKIQYIGVWADVRAISENTAQSCLFSRRTQQESASAAATIVNTALV